MMSEYWIISAPGEKTCAQTFDTMNNLTSKQHNLCNNYKFHIPDLKVGTLDQLVGLSDDLGKLDSYVEQITRKVAVYLGEVLEDQRDKLHENLLANNSPGPPDEIPCRHHQRIKNLSLRHQRKHQHTHHQNKPQHYHLQHHHQLPQDIKGKSTSTNQLTPSRDPSQAPSTPTLPTAAANAGTVPCACTITTPAPGSGSGGSLNNLSTTHDESERDFDFVIAPQPGGCLCEECGVFAPPSTSATASTLMADECYSHTASSMLSATRSALSTMAAIATGSNLGGGSSVGGASTSAAAAAAHAHGGHPPAAAAASAPAKNSSASTLCSSAYFSTSAPTTSSSVHSMSRSNSKKLNNNTCSINHNKLSFRSGSHVSQLNLPQHQQQNQNQQYQQKRDLSSSSPLQSPTQKSCDSSDMDADGGNTTDGDPKSPNSARSSDLSETFDWWFNKPKRNSKKSSAHQCEKQHLHQHQHQQQHQQLHQEQQQQSKAMTFWHQASTTPRSSYRSFFNSLADQIYSKRSTSSQLNINNGFNLTPTHRSSPVSSCCGSSSQGRSSPDTDNPEPPEFPLSPAELPQYLTRFQWDMAKYPIKQSLRNIADIISKQIGQIDGDLKTKSQAYNNLKGNLQNLEKKKTGSLLTRNLADLVKKEHFILDSEYLTTLLVIVPKVLTNDWHANYEKITDMIVPRSTQLIQEDSDYCLFNVTLFKKVTEEFKLHARERKFIVRDFVYNEEELAAGKNEMTKLMTDKKKQFGPLVRWLKVNFSEAFCALIHVKALRVFVESVLRYGLPVNFQAILIEPNKKSVKRLRDVLNQLYGHLDGASAGGQVSSADNVDIPGLGFGQSEYYPYVFYKVNIDMVEQSKV
ncbi:V-type proton ATPase subunit C isoform X6 [Drosophila miranda]|uniref:V-type proton ATPase subunit C isoform X1 n=1 Tax=Drosophila persimilis TaxID=7234 RepID=UPI000F09798B|nr:V-type proton ATPase subunit C isoform X1 [Drosophila persimilis]XP_033247649.1 V-type proton ATPase subunit C isoform X6 [Drosophila miranda]